MKIISISSIGGWPAACIATGGIIAMGTILAAGGVWLLIPLAIAIGVLARSSIGEVIAEKIRDGILFEVHRVDFLKEELRSERIKHELEEESNPRTEIPDGIIAIMFTDMENFTGFIERGDEAAFAILEQHNRIIRNVSQAHGGKIVKGFGDGFMIAFAKTREAVLAATNLQSEIEKYNEYSAIEDRISVRIGIEVGEPIKKEDDYFGRAVNSASRITAHARGGEVYISETVQKFLGPLKGLQYLDQGEHVLKGFKGKYRLFKVVRIENIIYPLDSDVETDLEQIEDALRSEASL